MEPQPFVRMALALTKVMQLLQTITGLMAVDSRIYSHRLCIGFIHPCGRSPMGHIGEELVTHRG